MRKILIVPLFFFSFKGLSQTGESKKQSDSLIVEIIQLPDSTSIGTADGNFASKEIGPAGGQIISDDGRVELVFPAGALTSQTTISVQPIVNLIPNGNGKGYQFEPSGIQFSKPVEIIFHYGNNEEQSCPPLLQFMAVQSANGKWQYQDYDDWDSTAETLKGHITHFSAFIDGNEIMLSPANISLKVGKNNSFILKKVEPSNSNEEETGDYLPPLPVLVSLSKKNQTNWYVNNIRGGNGVVGKIISTGKSQATYVAPNALPYPASVTIKVDISVLLDDQKILKWKKSRKGSKTLTPNVEKIATLKTSVDLYDEYRVNVSMDFGKGTDMEWIDQSSFTLKISDRVEINNIENMMLKVEIRSRCKPRYVNEASCTGMINVKGVDKGQLVNEQNHARVNITFQSASGSVLPVFDFTTCPNAKSQSPPVFGIAFPVRLSFLAKNESQIISLAKGNGAVVKKADPDDITATIDPIRN